MNADKNNKFMSTKARMATKKFIFEAPQKGFNPALLDKAVLLNPNFHKLNVFCNRNDRLLHVVMMAYAKHNLECLDIGWGELGDRLHDALCNEIGDDNYIKWAEQFKT